MTCRTILAASLMAAAVAAIGPAPARGADQDDALNLFQLGQSYRTPMDMVEAFAEARGETFRARGFLPPGVPIHAHGSKIARSRTLVGESDYDPPRRTGIDRFRRTDRKGRRR